MTVVREGYDCAGGAGEEQGTTEWWYRCHSSRLCCAPCKAVENKKWEGECYSVDVVISKGWYFFLFQRRCCRCFLLNLAAFFFCFWTFLTRLGGWCNGMSFWNYIACMASINEELNTFSSPFQHPSKKKGVEVGQHPFFHAKRVESYEKGCGDSRKRVWGPPNTLFSIILHLFWPKGRKKV